MRFYDVDTLFHYVPGCIDSESVADSIKDVSFDELVELYEALRSTVDVCLSCGNLPIFMDVIASFQYICGIEIVTRLLGGDEQQTYARVPFGRACQ